jgi:hypothetical protein
MEKHDPPWKAARNRRGGGIRLLWWLSWRRKTGNSVDRTGPAHSTDVRHNVGGTEPELSCWREKRIPPPSVLDGRAGGRSLSEALSTSGSCKQSGRNAKAVVLPSPSNPAKKTHINSERSLLYTSLPLLRTQIGRVTAGVRRASLIKCHKQTTANARCLFRMWLSLR